MDKTSFGDLKFSTKYAIAAVPVMPGNLSKALGQVLLTQGGTEGESFEYFKSYIEKTSFHTSICFINTISIYMSKTLCLRRSLVTIFEK